MSYDASGPGKTAPKLAHDFRLFDPLKADPNANILSDHHVLVSNNASVTLPAGSCSHEYTTKRDQSLVPPDDLRARDQEKYRAAVVCRKCRIHADITIDLTAADDACPNNEKPLHHFERVPEYDVMQTDLLRYVWCCSSKTCGAHLTIDYRTSILSEDSIKSLTRTDLLNKRFRDIMAQDPTREGVKQATPMDALWRLRRYIADSLKPDHTKRVFPANNKRFMEAFGLYGQDCKDLLEGIGFKYADSETEPTWTLPDPRENDGMQRRLEDIDYELRACMYRETLLSGAINPAAEMGWNSADRDLDRTLGAQSYHRYVSVRRGTLTSEEQAPYFSLGALPDFGDSLLGFCFDRQMARDLRNVPTYYGHLQDIAQARGSEELQMKAVQLESMGLVSRREILQAYKELNVAESDDDERILNVFQAQQPDLSAGRQTVARQALLTIGKHRSSQLLKNAGSQKIETYEEALSWIGNGVNKETTDDFIISLCQMKMSDSAENTDLGRKALSIIASARQSNAINSWLATGNMQDYQLSIDEACQYLDISKELIDSNNTDLVSSAFVVARADKPGEYTEKAIKAVQNAMSGTSNTAAAQAPARGSNDWPVGLISHGNTCYLNSILQYYFSIKPLRDIILKFDEYKYDTLNGEKPGIRVGQRNISMAEIDGGIKFSDNLRQLFEQMITTPKAQIKPDEELVCRTFLDPTDHMLLQAEETKRRMTGMDAQPAGEALTNGTIAEDAVMTDEPKVSEAETMKEDVPSSASSVTLAGSETGDGPDEVQKSVETTASPSADPSAAVEAVEASAKPPALPPRPAQPRRGSMIAPAALNRAQENARNQQDAAEVHDSCMFRMRAGIRPIGKEARGEQQDELRKLFAIQTCESIMEGDEVGEPSTQVMEYIQLAIPSENTDIYTAMEQLLDAQDEKGRQKHITIQDFPKVLQVNIPRNSYTNEGAGGYRAFKVLHDIRLENELYLDRFSDQSHPDVLQRRRACWMWRRELQALKRERKVLTSCEQDLEMDAAASAAESVKFLQRAQEMNSTLEELGLPLDIDTELANDLNEDSLRWSERLADLNNQIETLESKLRIAFDDLKNVKYRLHAVFFHRGGAGSGHYWVYIFDFAAEIWRQYNDETVSQEQDLNKIFNADGKVHGTPTYAVYVRDDVKEEVVQPLCRHIEADSNEGEAAASDNTWVGDDDILMGGGESQTAQPFVHVDPKLVMEGGENSWDTPRETVEGINW